MAALTAEEAITAFERVAGSRHWSQPIEVSCARAVSMIQAQLLITGVSDGTVWSRFAIEIRIHIRGV